MKRTILLLTVAALVFASCGKETVAPTPTPEGKLTLNCVRPAYLKAGDTIALISPAYYTAMENVEATADLLRSWGFVPVIGPNVGKLVDGKYAGTVAERVSDLLWAFGDPSIKAIICNRGGYGTIQLIDQIPLSALSASPKWLVGFSDISTLHGLLNRAGVMSVHGTMSSFLAAGGTDETSTLMRDLLKGEVPCYRLLPHAQNIEGTASGVLVGGNLCTVAPNVGSQADATMGHDIILFVEEVGESMHNIDRQMRILQMNGVLDRCKGVVLGEFSDCGSEFTYENVEAMIRQIVEPYGIPMLCGFPAGHGDVNLPLVMGAPVTIDVRGDGATLRFNIDSQQRDIATGPAVTNTKSLSDRLRMAGKVF